MGIYHVPFGPRGIYHVPFGPKGISKFKPKGKRKMLFGLKGTCILQKVKYLLAPSATMDACSIQANVYEEMMFRPKGTCILPKVTYPLAPIPEWTFAKKRMLFRPEGTCILQKVTCP